MPLPQVVEKAIARGWSVIPVRADKRPAIKSWTVFQKAPASLDQANKWARLAAVKGWAVIAGAVSKLVILDFDGVQGRKTCQMLGLIPHVRTPNGGFHVYFEHPGWKVPTLNAKSSRALGERWPAMDIRADGGYAVFWGELAGGSYRWSRKAELEPLSRLPQDLRQFLNLERSAPAPRAAGQAVMTPPPAPDLAGRLLDHALTMARSAGRNNAGFWYACQLRDNGVPEQLARGLMERYAAACPPTNQKGNIEAYTVQEAYASLRIAYAAPARDPIPQKRQRQPKPASSAPAAGGAKPPEVIPKEERELPAYAGDKYVATKRGLLYWRRTKDGAPAATWLTNFPAAIIADVVKDDGETTARALKIRAEVNGHVKDVVISASEFVQMNWPIEELGTSAIVYPNLKEHARTAMQELSSERVEQYLYQHTGWSMIEGKPVYLHAGGGIGEAGPVPGLAVELERELRRIHLPDPPSGQELKTAIRASMNMLRVAPYRVTLPLYSAVWRSVLGLVDCSIHLSGQTGTGKSQLAALCQQHFGAGLDAKHLPASWDSTANALQAICFYTKNALVVVDDFVPKGSASDVARLHREADRLLRAQGNHAGRQRMTADARIRPPRTPRGLILSTGEDVPKGNSLRARLVVVEMDPADMKWDILTACQADAAAGLYAKTMSGFLQWVAPRMPTMGTHILEHLSCFREEWNWDSRHKRTPDNLANLSAGLEVFLEFAEQMGGITKCDADNLWQEAMEAFHEAANAQDKAQSHSEPTQQFLERVAAALTSGQAHLVTCDGGLPDHPAAFGWTDSSGDWRPQGMKIGWLQGDDLYLERKAAFAAAQRIGKEIGEAVPVTLNTLGKRLKQRGVLVSVEPGREMNSVRKRCEGQYQQVWHILRTVLYREKKPDNPTYDH